jgi:hypothetical protein
MPIRTAAVLPLALLLTACQDQNFSRARVSDDFMQSPSNQVDILWVIDNSISMQNEQQSVAVGAADFMTQLETTSMDFHLGVISSDVDQENASAGVLLGNPPVLDPAVPDYQGAFAARVQMGTGGSDQEKGLQAAITAIRSPLADTRNGGFIRDGAMLNIVVVSDENDCSDNGALGAAATGTDCYDRYSELTPVADLVRELKVLKGDDQVVLSGIVGPEVIDGCEDTVPGRRYFTAIEMLGGVRADICQTDYGEVMNALGVVASGILTTFTLSKNAIEETIEVVITPEGEDPYDVAADATNGWTYNATYAQVTFNGTSVPPRGAAIEISYEVAGGTVQVAPEDTAAPAR